MPKISPVSYKLLRCVFEKDGFVFSRQDGSHMSFIKQGIIRPIVIPTYNEIPVFIIRNNLRTAGMSRDRYFELLEECR
jgi:predicted RNA binding protein YcfA (HicA-like mRNA interferase family)